MSDPTSKPHIAQTLLLNSHPPQIASTIFSEKVLQKRLVVRGASPDPTSHDARAQRRLQRLRAKEKKTARSNSKSKSKAEVEKEVEKEKENEKEKKPKPLSARQKRVSGIYKIPPSKQKYEIYRGLNRMWVGYMWEILGLVRVDDDDHGGQGQGRGEWVRGGGGGGGGKATAYVTAQSAGNVLASADFHGAEVMVVRSRCVGMVGLKGIVVRDTKFTFQVITKGDRLKSMCSCSCSSLSFLSGVRNMFQCFNDSMTDGC